MYIYTVLGVSMIIRWTKSQVGTVLDENGHDYKGQKCSVAYLKQDGTQGHKHFGGFIEKGQCEKLQRAKLVGFTSYSKDDGHTWVDFDKNTYLVGVVRWDMLYVVLYEGVPRSIPYTPLEPIRYYNNVVNLTEFREKR